MEVFVFHLKRVFKTNPGMSRKVASLAYKEAQIFKDAGQRNDFSVYFNGGTTPGEKDLVVLEWTDDSIQSIFRDGNDVPKEALNIGREILELCIDNWLEINELLTPDKLAN